MWYSAHGAVHDLEYGGLARWRAGGATDADSDARERESHRECRVDRTLRTYVDVPPWTLECSPAFPARYQRWYYHFILIKSDRYGKVVWKSGIAIF